MITFRNLYRDMKEFQLSLHLNVTGSANSKVIDSKKTQKIEPPQNRFGDNKPTCTSCGRFFHVKDKCPDLESKYANKTNSPYVRSAAHSLLVKETGPRRVRFHTKRLGLSRSQRERFRKSFQNLKKLLTRSSLEARKIGKCETIQHPTYLQ